MSVVTTALKKIYENEGIEIYLDKCRYYSLAEDYISDRDTLFLEQLYHCANNGILEILCEIHRDTSYRNRERLFQKAKQLFVQDKKYSEEEASAFFKNYQDAFGWKMVEPKVKEQQEKKTAGNSTSAKSTGGSTGAKSTSGTTSTKSTAGSTGTKSTSGTTSVKSTAGSTGAKSTSGTTSAKSTAGSTGAKSTSGTTSAKSTAGSTGAKSTSGTTSAKSTAGSTGAKSTSGTTSAKSTAGSTGAKSTSGSTSGKSTTGTTAQTTAKTTASSQQQGTQSKNAGNNKTTAGTTTSKSTEGSKTKTLFWLCVFVIAVYLRGNDGSVTLDSFKADPAGSVERIVTNCYYGITDDIKSAISSILGDDESADSASADDTFTDVSSAEGVTSDAALAADSTGSGAVVLTQEPQFDQSVYQPVTVTYAYASYQIQQEEGIDNSPIKMFDGDRATRWQLDVVGLSSGETAAGGYFDQFYQVKYISFNLGNWYNHDLYDAYGIPYVLNLTLGDFSQEIDFPADRYALENTQWIEFTEPVTADSIGLEIRDVLAGNRYADTCIAEITIYGTKE